MKQLVPSSHRGGVEPVGLAPELLATTWGAAVSGFEAGRVLFLLSL